MEDGNASVQIRGEAGFMNVEKIKFKPGISLFDRGKETEIAWLQVVTVITVSRFYFIQIDTGPCRKPSVDRLADTESRSKL